MDENHSLSTPVLDSHASYNFKPLQTTWIVYCLIFLLLIVEFITLLYVFVWTDSPVRCDLFKLTIYGVVCVWTTFFIVRFYINWKHKICLMAYGYLEFYETASRYIELPFYIFCMWLCILLVITCMYVEHCGDISFFCDTSSLYSPIIVVTTAISLQNMLLIPLFSVYIMKVYEYNKSQSPPDSERGNQWMPNTLRESLASEEMGYRERSEMIHSILENQADLIRYYRETNEVLNKKIFYLTSQSRAILDN